VAYDKERFSEKRRLQNLGFRKEYVTWQFIIDSHWILLGVHIDDFVIVGANQTMLDALRKSLLEAFEGTYKGLLEHCLGCEIARDHITSTNTLSQKHYVKEIL